LKKLGAPSAIRMRASSMIQNDRSIPHRGEVDGKTSGRRSRGPQANLQESNADNEGTEKVQNTSQSQDGRQEADPHESSCGENDLAKRTGPLLIHNR
jgi:hypothetical protein